MSLQLNKIILDYLKNHPSEKFTARQIAEWIFNTYPAECQEKKSKSKSSNMKTDGDLIQQLVAEIGSWRPSLQKKDPKLKITEGRPRKYYYSQFSDSEEIQKLEEGKASITPNSNSPKINEHDLYPLLSQYLQGEFEVYSKRINEKRSSNTRGSNGNRWLHPDLVGMEDLSADWNQEVCNCVREYSDKRTKLWSFEVKLLINRANARECFFQTVSNSSWANFGYLVAAEIEGQDTLKELRMLFAAHGIGFIKLDVENPTDSQVLIPAREREDIDWDMVNRLVEENKDFLEYVKLVKQFYQTGEVRSIDWDAPAIED